MKNKVLVLSLFYVSIFTSILLSMKPLEEFLRENGYTEEEIIKITSESKNESIQVHKSSFFSDINSWGLKLYSEPVYEKPEYITYSEKKAHTYKIIQLWKKRRC